MTDLRHCEGCTGESVREDDVSDGRKEPGKVEAQVVATSVGVQQPTKNDLGLFEP